MNVTAALIALGLSAHLLASCQRTKVEGAIPEGSIPQNPVVNAEPAMPKDKDAMPKGEPSDAIIIPEAITGALLHCRSFPSEDEVALDVKCFFQNESGQRVPGSLMSKEQEFGYQGQLDSSILISILPATDEYEVTYRFIGENFPDLISASRALSYLVSFTRLVNGDADVIVEAPGETAIEISRPLFTREPTTDKNANGACDQGESCLYQGAGLMWFRDLGAPKNFLDASNTCKDFTAGFDDYRLPTADEMEWAYLHGIVDFAGEDKLALRDLPMWTSDAGGVDGSRLTFNPFTGLVDEVSDSEQQRSFCVREFL